MPISRRSQIIIGLVILGLAVVGAALYYFVFKQETITFNSYLCEDESFYFVLQDKGAIEIAGKRYELVSSENGDRYEGAGPIVYTITGNQLRASYRESGETIADCALGPIDAAPIIQTNN
ncbi:MAG TPA: hypothetical protein VNU25_01805 [Candidatus Paceibacterota bacterium]|nr:hypothetical protein [Candidatus Paceibacterota bacterium]